MSTTGPLYELPLEEQMISVSAIKEYRSFGHSVSETARFHDVDPEFVRQVEEEHPTIVQSLDSLWGITFPEH